MSLDTPEFAPYRAGGHFRWRKENLAIQQVSDVSENMGDFNAGNIALGQSYQRRVEYGDDANIEGMVAYDEQNRPYWRVSYKQEYFRLGLAGQPGISYDGATGDVQIDGRAIMPHTIPGTAMNVGGLATDLLEYDHIDIGTGVFGVDFTGTRLSSGGLQGYKNESPVVKWNPLTGYIESYFNDLEYSAIKIGSGKLQVYNRLESTDGAIDFTSTWLGGGDIEDEGQILAYGSHDQLILKLMSGGQTTSQAPRLVLAPYDPNAPSGIYGSDRLRLGNAIDLNYVSLEAQDGRAFLSAQGTPLILSSLFNSQPGGFGGSYMELSDPYINLGGSLLCLEPDADGVWEARPASPPAKFIIRADPINDDVEIWRPTATAWRFIDDAAKLQGFAISTTDPTDGQALVYVVGTTKWTPTTVVHNASKLQDFDIDTTDPTNLQVLQYLTSTSKWTAQTLVTPAPTNYPYLGIGTDAALSAEVDVQSMQLVNEIKGWPPVVQPDADLDTLNLWWDSVGTPTTKPTVVDVAGETGITETYELALKCVADAASEGLSQTWTFADEPRVKSGRKLSALLAIWSVSGASVTAKLVNSDASETAASAVTAAAWTLVEIPNHTLAGTTCVLQVTAGAAGTFYVVPLGVCIGSRGLPLAPRGLRYVEVAAATTLVNRVDSAAAWTDVDVTANTSALAVAVQITGEYENGTTAPDKRLSVRRNGSTLATGQGGMLTNALYTNRRFTGRGIVFLDDANIFEYVGSDLAADTEYCTIMLNGFWEWE